VEFRVENARVELVQGDITRQDTDAIVNAANPGLMGGGGVDGAIHRAGGPEILEECRRLGGCPPGEARITTGGRLAARYVIHAVGPVYYNGTSGEPEKLASAYRCSLTLADTHGLRSVSFPSISTGNYGYPVEQAAPIALRTVIDYLRRHPGLELVRFVLYDTPTYAVYEAALHTLAAEPARPQAER